MSKNISKITCYYWYCSKTKKRVSWFFGTKKVATKWKESECYKYLDSPSLDAYLRGRVSAIGRKRETKVWTIHRDRWRNWVLKTARIHVRIDE